MVSAIRAFAVAADARDADELRRSAVDVSLAALDLALRYSGPATVDLNRMADWSRQLLTDAGDAAAMRADVATVETIWASSSHAVTPAAADRVEDILANLRDAAETGDADDTSRFAEQLIVLLEGLHDGAS